MAVAKDVKRTGVQAESIKMSDSRCEFVDGLWYGPPGGMIRVQGDKSGTGHIIACPGCGQFGSGREGARWTVAGGSLDDVTTLTLNPSIAKSCCGWHGYLRNGVFESC
ncbi:MAG: hypothetical protein IT428_31430 [Planctomycetaceae bacterium]|nr:hypothetical protein [Planctomycetaceae bacterium]